MGNRVLIAYASKRGSTGEVAEAIGESLRGHGVAAEVHPIRSVPSPDGHGAAVIGSAIRFGQWLPEPVAFVDTHQGQFRAIPTAISSVDLLALDDSEASQERRQAYTAPVRAIAATGQRSGPGRRRCLRR